MPVGASVAGKPGIDQPQAVQKLCHRAERAPNAGHAGSLVQRQCCRDVADVVDVGARRLRHAPAGVSRQGFQIAPGPFRIEDAQRQGGLSGAGYARDRDDLVERNIHIYILQVMYPGSAHLHAAGQDFFRFCHVWLVSLHHLFKARVCIIQGSRCEPLRRVRAVPEGSFFLSARVCIMKKGVTRHALPAPFARLLIPSNVTSS